MESKQMTQPPVAYERMLDVDFRRIHRVRWIETDASGFVNFPCYVRMMEETEYAFLRSLGLSIVMNDDRGVVGFPRASADVQIHNPARMDDELVVWLRVVNVDGIRIEYQFEISRDSDVIATGTFVLACCRFPVDEPPRAILIPSFFLDRFPKR